MTTAAFRDDPILADAADVRSLVGLSGARVFLMTRDGRHWFVRKAARDAEGSARLRRQLAKQLMFADSAADVVRTPRILGEGEVEGRFYFDMEFIRGADGVSWVRRAAYGDVVALADRLCAYLDAVAARAPLRPAAETLFEALYAKLCDVQRRTDAISGDTLARLFVSLERVRRSAADLAPTMCHGDLTLENLVVDESGGVWLLDFLDAPFEHWWQDVAKLHQDLDGSWFLLSQPPIAQCVLEYLSRRLCAAATRLDPRYPEVHDLLLACTFVRILPYARTAEERAFVKARIEHFAHREKP